MIVMFQILILIVVMTASCFADIEFFSAGKRFESFKDYQKGAQKPTERSKIDQISFNRGVEESLLNFNHNWRTARFIDTVDSSQLENTLQEAIGKDDQPALLISDAGKLRILSFKVKSK